MLKKTITYTNFDGDTVTEDFYFNMTKAELVELSLSETEDFGATLQAIVEAEDGAKIISYFKKIVLMSYGEKSEDGRRFLKSEDMANAFSHTEAYSQLFMELATNATAASVFVNGIMPADLMQEVAAVTEKKPEPIVDVALNVDSDVALVDGKKVEELTRSELEALLQKKLEA